MLTLLADTCRLYFEGRSPLTNFQSRITVRHSEHIIIIHNIVINAYNMFDPRQDV